MKESSFQNKIKKHLEEQGAYVLKYNASGISRVGVPDLISCINGIFVGIEVKVGNNKPTELQLYNLQLIEKAKGISMVIYPKDFEEFKQTIEKIGLK